MAAAVLVAAAATVLHGQVVVPPDSKCQPIAQRSARIGCWIVVDHAVGAFSQPQVFWYLDTFPTRAAADAAKGDRGVAVEALDRHWVMTMSAEALDGTHTGRIGPLPVKTDVPYSAMYMETINPPGFQSAVHTHSGPEAWFNLAGAMCLETPEGPIRDTAGSSGVFVRGDVPMLLTSTGTSERRAVVVILHESARPPITIEHAWTPKGTCTPH